MPMPKIECKATLNLYADGSSYLQAGPEVEAWLKARGMAIQLTVFALAGPPAVGTNVKSAEVVAKGPGG